MRLTIAAILIGVAATLAAGVSAQPPKTTVEITYIANEGFLIQSGGQKILIDALFRGELAPYAAVPPEWLEKMETAQAPFDTVDLVLVSHHHADHFHAGAVARHLAHNSRAILISSPQVVGAVTQVSDNALDIARRLLAASGEKPGAAALSRLAASFSGLRQRLRTVPLEKGVRTTFAVEGIGIQVQAVSHGNVGPVVENLGHIITLGGIKLLHVGDAFAPEEDLKAFQWEQEGIDIALLPFWYLAFDDGKAVVERYIRPKQVVAMHIPPGEIEKWEKEIRVRFPSAIIFTRALEKKVLLAPAANPAARGLPVKHSTSAISLRAR